MDIITEHYLVHFDPGIAVDISLSQPGDPHPTDDVILLAPHRREGDTIYVTYEAVRRAQAEGQGEKL